VGSTSKNHTSGKAADIKATDGPTRGKILKGLYRAGFQRIGVAKDFIHADSMDEVESAWFY
ncbi:MAG: peptidase M15, partial [Planctomycetota bacterium]